MNTVKPLRILTNGQDMSTIPVTTHDRSWPATTSPEHHKVIKELQVVRVTTPTDLDDDTDEDDL